MVFEGVVIMLVVVCVILEGLWCLKEVLVVMCVEYICGNKLVEVDWCFYICIVEMVGNFVLVDMVGIFFDSCYSLIVVCMSGEVEFI